MWVLDNLAETDDTPLVPIGDLSEQTHVAEFLSRALSNASLAHAYLFWGADLVVMEKAARLLAQAVNCERTKADACGACSTCTRIASDRHPDVQWVMSQAQQVAKGLVTRGEVGRTPSRDVRVEQVRTMTDRLILRPLEGRSRVVVFAGAEQLNLQAQNALLKTLEEPPAGALILLLTLSPDKLLPTVRSRCVPLQFRPPAVAGGDGQQQRSFDEVRTAFSALTTDDARTWLQFAEEYASTREDAESVLECLEHQAVSQLRATGALAYVEGLELIRQVRNAVSSRNGAPRLQVERLCVEWFGRIVRASPSARLL